MIDSTISLELLPSWQTIPLIRNGSYFRKSGNYEQLKL